jgi:hypothetical protein
MKNMTLIDRREFLRRAGATAAIGLEVGTTTEALAAAPKRSSGVRAVKEPVAIAMWDFSWALRRNPGCELVPGCEFTDWDRVLDGLVERGYNAIRFDVFPPLVATGPDGRINDSHHFPQGSGWKPVAWGNQFTTTLHPRQALKEFIPRCLDRGLRLAFSTWFQEPGTVKVEGLDGLVRVWDETLAFLKDNDLLHNIYYVDLLNEYPLYSGFASSWLCKQMDQGIETRRERAKAEGVHEWNEKVGRYNDPASRKFYVGFANDAIARLQAKWPDLDFLFSVTNVRVADWRVMAPTSTAALDMHNWFEYGPHLTEGTDYSRVIFRVGDSDADFPKVQAALLKNWVEYKPKLIEWMDAHMAEVAALCRQYNKPVGNTEGWGLVNWIDHPALTWDIIKEAGGICARLARKHGYRFICTSNFTHPQFPRLWADVAWHKQTTAIIRG